MKKLTAGPESWLFQGLAIGNGAHRVTPASVRLQDSHSLPHGAS